MNQYAIGLLIGLSLAAIGTVMFFLGHPFRHQDAIGWQQFLLVGGSWALWALAAAILLAVFIFWMLSKT